jgi:hypothetical protein
MAELETLRTLGDLLNDLINGTCNSESWVLNREDSGLLKSLDVLTSEQASKVPISGGSSIAAHVDHLRYGFQLLNRWSDGDEQAFAGADFSGAWRRNTVSEEEWAARRKDLAREALDWRESLEDLKNGGPGIDARIASVVHLAYHLGAIRQINRSLRGPVARD